MCDVPETYRVLSYEEAEALELHPYYDHLVGPHGFRCTLTEPEDRTWTRDCSTVVVELNNLHTRLQRALQVLAAVADFIEIDYKEFEAK